MRHKMDASDLKSEFDIEQLVAGRRVYGWMGRIEPLMVHKTDHHRLYDYDDLQIGFASRNEVRLVVIR
jgi:hypothetical protein